MSSPDSNALTLKLEHGAKLDDADKAKLVQMTRSARDVRAHIDLIREGEKPDCVRLILSGFACRYKLLDHGSRSIMGYLLPGDFCDLHVSILGEMDHNIATFSECSVVEIDNNEMDELIEASPRIARAFWWAELVEQAIQRQWLVNMARRPADQRLAHLLCELLPPLKSRRCCRWKFLPATTYAGGDSGHARHVVRPYKPHHSAFAAHRIRQFPRQACHYFKCAEFGRFW